MLLHKNRIILSPLEIGLQVMNDFNLYGSRLRSSSRFDRAMNASCPALRNAFLLRFVDFPRHWLELAQFSLAFGRVVCQIVEKENRLIGWPTNVKMPTIRPSCTNKSVVIFEIKFDNFNALLGC